MRVAKLISELESELTKIGVRVRREKGNFQGGWCVVNDERVLMLNKRHSAELQFSVLAEALRSFPLDSVYIRPNLRDALEEYWERHPADEVHKEMDDG